jgi:dTDP-4-dehydrorhamnose reductase
MKIAVLGATGMLGSMLVKVLSRKHQVVATIRRIEDMSVIPGVTWRHLDACHSCTELPDAINDCQWVINAIGEIPQRYGNDSPSMRYINTILPLKIADFAERQGSRVIQIATDCVYSGRQGNYSEADPHDCTDRYGQTKSSGEPMFDNVNILRCSIVGPESHGKSLLGWFLSLPEEAIVDGYTNHFWNGITTLSFAKICEGIIEQGSEIPRIQHIIPADSVSKYQLLRIFNEAYRRNITIREKETAPGKDMRLYTHNPEVNEMIWWMAGYENPPTIEAMVKEIAENV